LVPTMLYDHLSMTAILHFSVITLLSVRPTDNPRNANYQRTSETVPLS
jgi:hypothetical protein